MQNFVDFVACNKFNEDLKTEQMKMDLKMDMKMDMKSFYIILFYFILLLSFFGHNSQS